MRAVTALIGMLVILCCSIWRQSGQTFDQFPILLVDESVEFLRTETHGAALQNIQNNERIFQSYNIIDKQINIYKITLYIKLRKGIESFSKPFAVKLVESNGDEKIFGLNIQEEKIIQGRMRTFQIETAFNSTGYAKIIVGKLDNSNGEFLFDNYSPSITEASLFIEEPS